MARGGGLQSPNLKLWSTSLKILSLLLCLQFSLTHFLAHVPTDISSSEVIHPSAIIPNRDLTETYSVCSHLQYLPSLKCLSYLTTPRKLTFINDSNFEVLHTIHIHQARDELKPRICLLCPEKNLIALGVPYVYFAYDHRLPTHVRLAKIPQNLFECELINSQSTKFLNPHMYNCRINHMKLFPDGSRLLVTYANERRGSWCKIFTLPETLDDEGNSCALSFVLIPSLSLQSHDR